MPESREIVIVGGGPAGSSAALLLRQLGHDVLLLDEARFPRDKVCGEALSPGAWHALEAIGAAAAVAAAGARPLSGMTVVAPNGTSFSGRYDGGRTHGYAIERRVLDALLLERARQAGVDVRENTRVTRLLHGSNRVRGVRAERDGTPVEIQARLIVGADGRRSRVARELGLLREAARPRRFAVRGHWDGVPDLTAFGEMHVGGGGYCGMAPLGTASANVTFVLDQPALRAAGSDLRAFYLATLPRWPGLWQRLSSATLRADPRAVGPLALESRGACAPGVFLVGDAAGFLDPFTGEGMAVGIRGAMLAAELGHAVLAGRAGWGDYGAAHRRLSRKKFRFNRAVQWLVPRRTAANLAASGLAHLPWLADRLVGIAGDCVGTGSRSGRQASALLLGRNG